MKKTLTIILFCLTATVVLAGDGFAADMDLTERMMMLVIQLGIILFAARLGNMLFEHIHLPGVLGEVTAGILIGPYVLGGIRFYGFPNGLFPQAENFPVSPELYGLCAVAAVILLFTVGLETNVRLLIRYSLAGTIVGIGGVIFSFVLGDLVTVVFSRMLFGSHLGFFAPQCLFLGVICTATSVGITSRILSEKRKLDSPEGVTILAGAVIDDILGIILLAVVLGIIAASKATGSINWVLIGIIAGKAVSVWLVATAIGLIASRKISFLLKLFQDRSTIALTALGLALVLAGFFEHAGLAMIIGAYVMGLSLSQTDITHVIREKLGLVYEFLIPVFFCVTGMLLDFRIFASKTALIFGVAYTAVAILAKVAGCGLPTMLCGFNRRGALRIGFGMLPRCEIALIIAGIGLAKGVVSQEIIGVSVFLMAATMLVAPPIIVALFKNNLPGTRCPIERSEGKTVTFSFPSPEITVLLVSKVLSSFESEGFFAHLLNRSRQVYQLRKDDMVIGFQHKGTDIVFNSRESEVPLINTAMYEVVGELEQTIRRLREPVDGKAIARRIQDQPPTKRTKLSLARYLQIETLEPNLKGTEKRDVIDELIGILAGQKLIRNVDEARDTILEREQSMSTGMQYGIAIPHGRTDAVDSLVCAVGLSSEGVNFDSIDGELSKIIVLALSPKSATAPHMQFMSMVSQILDKEGRNLLLACETPEEMYSVLTADKAATELLMSRKVSPAMKMARVVKRKPSELTEYLRPELLEINLKGETKDKIIDELLSILNRNGLIKNLGLARSDVLARENQMSSGIEHGVAIPHAKTDAVNDLVCSIGIKREGIDFGAIDSMPSKIVVLSLAPKSAPAPHIKLMATIIHALDEEGRKRALSARSREELYKLLVG